MDFRVRERHARCTCGRGVTCVSGRLGVSALNPSGPTRVFTDHSTDHFICIFFV